MMKRLLFALSVMASVFHVGAFDFSTMKFETISGIHYTIDVDGLTMNIQEGVLTVSNCEGQNLSLPVSELSKFYFVPDLSSLTAITVTDGDEADIYTLQGIRVGHFASVTDAQSSLKSGIYVCVTPKRTFKLVVK